MSYASKLLSVLYEQNDPGKIKEWEKIEDEIVELEGKMTDLLKQLSDAEDEGKGTVKIKKEIRSMEAEIGKLKKQQKALGITFD